MMISTQNPGQLPAPASLQKTAKAIAVLDAIFSPEWEFRFYSYNNKWSEGEACLQMRDGEGDEMHILFRGESCAINGFAHECPQPEKSKITKGLPEVFTEFISGEPVGSIGTTFCLWNTCDGWKMGEIESFEDKSAEMLKILDGYPQTYLDYATEYFELDEEANDGRIKTIGSIYKGDTLTKEMVESLSAEVEDWEQLSADLDEIGYDYSF